MAKVRLMAGPPSEPVHLDRQEFMVEMEMVFCGHNERAHPGGSDRLNSSLT